MIDVVVPAEQEGTQAVVRAWLKQVGDRVEENDPLVELETDKVAMEVPAPAAGVLREILLHTDDKAEPGAILGRIGTAIEVTEESARPEREWARDAQSRTAPVPGREASFASARYRPGADPGHGARRAYHAR